MVHQPGPVRIRRVVSTRAGGHSRPPYDTFNLGGRIGDDATAVSANRTRLAELTGVPLRQFAWMQQVHGRHVETLHAAPGSALAGCDGMVTATPGVALAVLAADCVPVLLWDEHAGVVGAAHAGREGTRLGVAGHTLEQMVRLGARPERTHALLGPAICGQCYEVPPQMQRDIEQQVPGSACRTRQGTTGLDLRAGLTQALRAQGVQQIELDPRCTAEDPTLFSYRRDGVTGRLAAVIWIEEVR